MRSDLSLFPAADVSDSGVTCSATRLPSLGLLTFAVGVGIAVSIGAAATAQADSGSASASDSVQTASTPARERHTGAVSRSPAETPGATRSERRAARRAEFESGRETTLLVRRSARVNTTGRAAESVNDVAQLASEMELGSIASTAPQRGRQHRQPARLESDVEISATVGRTADRADDNLSTRLAGRSLVGKPVVGEPVKIEDFQAPSIAASPDGDTLYVTGWRSAFKSDLVAVVDARTMKTTSTIRVGGDPRTLALSPDGSTLYVNHWGTFKVSVLDTKTATVTNTITLREPPSFYATLLQGADEQMSMVVSPDGAHVYVMSTKSGKLSVIDTRTQTLERTIEVRERKGIIDSWTVNAPDGIAISGDGATMYVTDQDEKSVATFDLAKNTVIRTHDVGAIEVKRFNPTARIMALAPDGLVYLASFAGDSIKVFDPRLGKVVKRIAVGNGPVNVTVSPNGAAIYVINGLSKSVSVISSSTGAVSSTSPISFVPNNIVFTADGAQAFVIGRDGDETVLARIDTALTVQLDS